MADWKKMLKEILLADGTVDGPETAIISQEIMADGQATGAMPGKLVRGGQAVP